MSALDMKSQIAILYPTDPLGYVPSGIDSFIKGIMKWSPPDLEYTLFGASSDTAERPLGQSAAVPTATGSKANYVPVVSMQASARRDLIPLTVRYMSGLRRYIRRGLLRQFQVLDFHRIEPLLLFRRDGRPKNLIVHADSSVLRQKNCDIMWKHWPGLYEAIERRAFPLLDRIFAVRRSAVERYSRIYPPIADRFAFLPTWMDSELFRPPASEAERVEARRRVADEFGLDVEQKLAVFVGRLDYQKDPVLLLNALGLLRESGTGLQLLLIGDGILRPEVESLLAAYPTLAAHVRLLGARKAAQIADILRASDLFVLSSAYEGMSIALLEALACGLPAVSTQVGEVDLVLTDGINGQICKDRTANGLADSIRLALGDLDSMRGPPCLKAVAPYRPEQVLARIYENHRQQLSGRAQA